MNRAFHIAIVLVVAAHMLCGCCLHHAHAYGGRSDVKALSVEASCPCHHGSAEPGQSCDHTSQHQPCDGDRCVFTRRDLNDAPDVSIGHGSLNPLCVSPGTGTSGTGTLGGIDRVNASLGKLGSPIPLHLLNQALLL